MLSILAMFACTQEDDPVLQIQNHSSNSKEDNLKIELAGVQLRSSGEIPTALDQLYSNGMPFYLISNDGRYLTASTRRLLALKIGEAILATGNDQENQQWILENTPPSGPFGASNSSHRRLKSVKTSVADLNYLGLSHEDATSTSKDITRNLKMVTQVPNPKYNYGFGDNLSWYINYLPSNGLYNIRTALLLVYRQDPNSSLCTMSPYTYLSAESPSSSKTILSTSENIGKQNWKIEPAEEYKIDKMEYFLNSGNNFIPLKQYVYTKELKNNTSIQVNKSETFKSTVTLTSTFSETEGLSISNKISATYKVGVNIPLVSTEGSISTENTISKNWTYTVGGTETRQIELTDNVSFIVPPYTTIIADVFVMEYTLSLNYRVTLTGLKTGKQIKLEGKWNGVQGTYFSYELRDPKTNQLLKSVSRTPNSNEVIKFQ